MVAASANPVLAAEAYGLRFGEPLQLRECARLPLPPVANYRAPYAPVTAACTKPGATPDLGVIAFPPGTDAEFSVDGTIGYRLDGQTLASIVVATAGASRQSQILQSLTARHGTPEHLTEVPVSNAVGGSFLAVQARWQLPGMRVEFFGITGPHTAGRIVIGTPEGVAAHLSLLAR